MEVEYFSSRMVFESTVDLLSSEGESAQTSAGSLITSSPEIEDIDSGFSYRASVTKHSIDNIDGVKNWKLSVIDRLSKPGNKQKSGVIAEMTMTTPSKTPLVRVFRLNAFASSGLFNLDSSQERSMRHNSFVPTESQVNEFCEHVSWMFRQQESPTDTLQPAAD